jgi:hypothetical protein
MKGRRHGRVIEISAMLLALVQMGLGAAYGAADTDPAKRKPDEEAGKFTMTDELHSKALALRSIDFFNAIKDGTAISRATDSFDAATVVFVEWQVKFASRLNKRKPSQHRVDAVYVGTDERTMGAVNDFQSVSPSMKEVTFSGRVGNSHGGAFLPGTYTVDFYLDGEPFARKQFRVVADASGKDATHPGGELANSAGSPTSQGSPMSGSLRGPTIVAAGTVTSSGGSSEMEVKLHPHPDGFLTGEIDVNQSGFGSQPMTGSVHGTLYTFTVAYCTETYFFEGQLAGDQISGTFESQPTGERGTWTVQTR